MVQRNCAKSILSRTAEYEIDETEVRDIVESMETRIRESEGAGLTANSENMATILQKAQDDEDLVAAIKRRNTAYNTYRRQTMREQLQTMVDEGRVPGYYDAMLSAIWGREGSVSRSTMSQAQLYFNQWSTWVSKIEALGEPAFQTFMRGQRTREIMRAIYAIRRGEKTGDMDANDVGIAKVIVETQEQIRGELNRHGAWIGELDDFIISQFHDMDKIRAHRHPDGRKMTKGEAKDFWKQFVSERLDYGRTFGVTKQEILSDPKLRERFDATLTDLYERFSTGNHLTVDTKDGQIRGTGTGAANIGRRLSAQRTLHFTDADAFFEYQSEFGNVHLPDVVNAHVMSAARSAAILRDWGPNYADNVRQLAKEFGEKARKTGDDKSAMALGGPQSRNVDNAIASMDGSINVPTNSMLAKVMASARTIITSSKLGSAFLSMFSDPAFIMAEARVQGANPLEFFGRYLKGQGGIGRMTREMRELAQSFGLSVEVYRGSLLDDFAPTDASQGYLGGSGRMMRANRWVNETFSRVSLMGPATNASRVAYAIGLSDHLGRMASRGMDQLPKGMRRSLQAAGIDDAEWALLGRTVTSKEVAGVGNVRLMDPTLVSDLPDDVIDGYLRQTDSIAADATPSQRMRADARQDLADRLRTYLLDSSMSAVIETKPGTREQMRLGMQSGTRLGEAWKQILQFKTFPIAVVKQRAMRDVRLLGEQGAGIWKNAQHTAPALITMAVNATILGYAAMVAKDLVKGREPRSPNDPKTWLAAMAQGGAAGILGDFLFGDVRNRFGQNLTTTLLGPSASVVNDFATNISGTFGIDRWTGEEDMNVAAKWTRFAINNTPFANLFYTKPMLDYLFINRFMEAVDPGYMEKRARMMQETTGQKPLDLSELMQ